VKSRRNLSGAVRADLSGPVVPRRLRVRRATEPCSAISAATVFTPTRQPSAPHRGPRRGARTITTWRDEFLACFTTGRISNGPTVSGHVIPHL
jgi:hypothetical protein